MGVVDITMDADGNEVHREYPCVESMTRLKTHGFDIRVWRDESSVNEYDNEDLREVAKEIRRVIETENASAFSYPYEVARRFAQVPRVSAVEVLDSYGDGIVLYVTW